MRLLLDTHALLWFVLGDAKLSATARAAIEDPTNVKYVSPASYWEIAIKESNGQYVLSVPHAQFFRAAVAANGFFILPVEPEHTAAVIPLPKHHKDPFDRLIIAQAIVEDMTVVTVDAAFVPYPVRRLW